MKAAFYSLTGEKKGDMELPVHFSETVRVDLIKRAVLAQRSHSYQPHGADPEAGTKQGHATKKRRKSYKTTYGRGMSRIARKYSWHQGGQFGWIGAFVVNAVKGRGAFPPESDEIISEKINKKERRKAIRSAISATAVKELVEKRNHQIKNVKSLPLIVEEKMEDLKKAKDVKLMLEQLGLGEDLERVSERKIRAGKGKMRGRRYKTKVGPLIIVSKACSVQKAGRNLVDVVNVHDINAEALAPGTTPGRLTVWSKTAIEALGKEELFK